jgi:RNA polymerase sigma-70 factor, ECF subfamily
VSTADFEQVYVEFSPRIRRYLARVAGEHEAEDLTQEVFVRVSRALSGFRGDAKLSTWVYRIATNVALDRFRASTGDQPLDEAEVADPAATVEQTVTRDEMRDCVRSFVEALPTDARAVLALSDLEELTDREIAEVLGIGLEAMKMRLHRARARLRAAMTGGCEVYHDERNEVACHPKEPPVGT